ncbi:MAG: DUF4956 domain-containing protein, partial [Candidatus Riflebacteria bacterium]|nr:DUF4956 domain-containing protein [Candidatus Riflebacteria bacterium]
EAASDKSLSRTMILLGAVGSLIMAVIGNSLARAFGAIGALSLIRFRTAVKSTSDLAFLFMSIAIGMTCGSGYFMIATGATGLFAIFIVILGKFLPDGATAKVALIRVSYPFKEGFAARISEKMVGLGLQSRLLSETSLDGSSGAEMMFEITLEKDAQASDCIRQLCEMSPDIKASVVID